MGGVRFREMKKTKHHGGHCVTVMPCNPCFRFIHVTFLLTQKKKKIAIKTLKPANSHSLFIFSSTCSTFGRSRRVILALQTSRVRVHLRELSVYGEQGRRSGEGAPLPRVWLRFDFRTRRVGWVYCWFSPCCERFFSANSFFFSLSSKTNISKFQFNLESTYTCKRVPESS